MPGEDSDGDLRDLKHTRFVAFKANLENFKSYLEDRGVFVFAEVLFPRMLPGDAEHGFGLVIPHQPRIFPTADLKQTKKHSDVREAYSFPEFHLKLNNCRHKSGLLTSHLFCMSL